MLSAGREVLVVMSVVSRSRSTSSSKVVLLLAVRSIPHVDRCAVLVTRASNSPIPPPRRVMVTDGLY